MHRLLPLLAIFIVALVAYLYLPIRRELAYSLGISQDSTSSCCDESQVLSSDGNFDEFAEHAIFNDEIIDYPKTSLAHNAYDNLNSNVLGTTNGSGEEKWIEVILDEQKLRAWEGNRVVMEFLISSGKWASTPKGTYNIWYKTRSQKMEGGSKELKTYYYLPNVPHNMFFYKGYAIHGAYWHNNFGNPMSHGCVNAPLDKVGALFEWAGPVVPEGKNVVKATPENPGTRVWVH